MLAKGQFEALVRGVQLGAGNLTAPPHHFYEVLQCAIDCGELFGELTESFEHEEDKHKEKFKNLETAHANKLNSVSNAARQKVSTIQSRVKEFGNFADQVNASISDITAVGPNELISQADAVSRKRLSWESAVSQATQSKKSFDRISRNGYRNVAIWGGIGAAILAWVNGVSSTSGLAIGVLFAVGTFIIYGKNAWSGAEAIQELRKACKSEIATIKAELHEQTKDAIKQSEEQKKEEVLRFKAVTEAFEQMLEHEGKSLSHTLTQFTNSVSQWKEESKILFDHCTTASKQDATNESQILSRLSWLGAVTLPVPTTAAQGGL